MRIKAVSGIMLILLLIGMLTLAFSIQKAESSEPPATEWTRTYGGAKDDVGRSVVQTVDGGYALTGLTYSFGAGLYDSWLVKTDSSGNMQWNRTYGGAGPDEACSVVQTVDGGYALAGYTRSFGAGGFDFWLVKVAAPPEYTLTVCSSPTGVTLAVDGVSCTTPWSGTYSEGSSVSLIAPETYYGCIWSHWLEDGDPSRIKTVTMDTDITFTAVYSPVSKPVGGKAVPIDKLVIEPELQIPWIWLSTIILPLVATLDYFFRKQRRSGKLGVRV